MSGDLALAFVGFGLENFNGELDISGRGIDGEGKVKRNWLEKYLSPNEFGLEGLCHFVSFLDALM